jgi:dihydropteroate synthase
LREFKADQTRLKTRFSLECEDMTGLHANSNWASTTVPEIQTPMKHKSHPVWKTTRFELDLSLPCIMAIVNVTPDSFSNEQDASCAQVPQLVQRAIELAHAQLKAGAHVLDIGAESTRPGAVALSAELEWARLEPVLEEVIKWGVPISLDTYKPITMQKALEMGIDIINDVWALRQEGALKTVSDFDCGVCLMHMHAEPQTMQLSPMQGDVVREVRDFLHQQIQLANAAGVNSARIVLDPGIGFGKTVEQNFSLLSQQAVLMELSCPLLVGWSRKSSLGAITGLEVHERLVPSLSAALLAVERGAKVVRVHDVKATREALTVWQHASS